MTNKQLYAKNIGKKIQEVEIGDEYINLKLEEGFLNISTHHDQDCCEHVYGDFSVLKYHKERLLLDRILVRIELKGIMGEGFLICFVFGYEDEKIFIPCYNYQNGYYSDRLEVVIEDEVETTSIDISDYKEDNEG